MEFEGPWIIDCNSSTTTANFSDHYDPYPIYSGRWISAPAAPYGPGPHYNGTYTMANFTSTTLVPLQEGDGEHGFGEVGSWLSVQQSSLSCSPGRANFRVNHTYLNNIHSQSVTVNPIEKLVNMAIVSRDGAVRVPGLGAEKGPGFGTAPAHWSSDAIAYYRDQNMMTIFSAMLSWLDGDFLAGVYSEDLSSEPLFSNPTVHTNLLWLEDITTLITGVETRNSGIYT